jgi:proline iminopeptidase
MKYKNFFTLTFITILFPFILFAQRDFFAYAPDSTPIHYLSFGAGKVILIINGGPGMNCEGFTGLAEKLSITNRVILYDQRGTGKSKVRRMDASTITIDKMVSDIEALRESLHIQNWTVLGHSFGGMLASYYATKFPARIDKLILSSSGGIDLDLLNYVSSSINARLTTEQRHQVSYWTNRIAGGDTSHHARLQRGLNLAPAYVYDKKYVPLIAERLTQGNSTLNNLVWEDMRTMHFNCAPGLRYFDKPVLIIQGKEDIIKSETALKAHDVLNESKIIFLEHSVHYGWLDNPQEFFKKINEFLKGE